MIRTVALCTALLLAAAGSAGAQAVKLEFRDGQVNLSAQNVPVRAILAEWARLGGTRIINGDRVVGPPVSLELNGIPERQALDIVLRGVAGYMITVRAAAGPTPSHVDRVMILPTSTAPRPASSSATFAPPPQQPFFGDDPDDFGDDADERPFGVILRGRPGGPPEAGPTPGGRGTVTIQGGAPAPFLPPPVQEPAEAPAPVAPPRPSNPFTTLPGSSRPGEIMPAPQPGVPQPNVQPEQ